MKQGPFTIRHSGGKCVSTDSRDLLRLTSRCATQFAFTNDIALKETASGKCVVPESDADNAPLKLQSDCHNLRARFKQTTVFSVEHLSTGKCWHPDGGYSHPAERTAVVLHSVCNLDRLVFKFESGNFIFHHIVHFVIIHSINRQLMQGKRFISNMPFLNNPISVQSIILQLISNLLISN